MVSESGGTWCRSGYGQAGKRKENEQKRRISKVKRFVQGLIVFYQKSAQ